MMIGRGQKGFTLLEVLVAFTLLALLFGALLQVFAGGLAATRSGDSQSRAVLLAKSKLAEIGADERIGAGSHSGIFDFAGADAPEYRWRAELSRYVEDEIGRADRADLVPYRVNLEVTWETDRGERRFSLSSLVLRPK